MAEPFVFHFRRGESGHPEQMYLADIRAECGLCRHVQVQRYYHATPLHPVRVAVLDQLARTVHLKTDFECPNCSTPVGPEHALSTSLTWAFADDSGMICAFIPNARDPDTLRWQFKPHHRLDPQELPGWEPDPAVTDYGRLDDELIEDNCGRVTNPKAAIREVLLDWLDDPTGGAIARLSPDMTLIAAGPADALDALAEEVGDDRAMIRFDDCIPHALPTHREPAGIAGNHEGWLPDGVDRSQVAVLIDASVARDVLQRSFDVANLTYELDDDGFTEIVTPRDSPYPRPLPLDAVLRRAAYTGLTPGEAARLTAEEIVGGLLRVW